MTDHNRSVREDIVETPEGTSVVRSEVNVSATPGGDVPYGTPGGVGYQGALPPQDDVSVVRTQHSTTVIPNEGEHQRRRFERVKQIVTFVLGGMAALILMRFVLLLLGANQENGFANFIYSASYPLVAPFLGLFGKQPQYGQSVLEIEGLMALAVYAFVGWGLLKLWALVFQPGDSRNRPLA